MATIYIIDTNELIYLKDHYPLDIFPCLWKDVENLISRRKMVSPMQVLKEIRVGHDMLIPWSQKYRNMFHNTDRLLPDVQQILRKDYRLNPDDDQGKADPYIIALAKSFQNGLTDEVPVIVTGEKPGREFCIPDIAQKYGVDSCNLHGMIRREGWTF